VVCLGDVPLKRTPGSSTLANSRRPHDGRERQGVHKGAALTSREARQLAAMSCGAQEFDLYGCEPSRSSS
jgi:hypothetical protein